MPATPAGRLVAAFGDVAAMSRLYADAIEWSLPAGLPFPRPMRGREAVIAFNMAVWEQSYFPDCSVEILDEAGDEISSAVRFVYRARFRATGTAYENEYTLFARTAAGRITHVFEALDTIALVDQLTGAPVGAAFTAAVPR
ncbi:MAG: nuclear transport factor 2 family protein [Micropepsaceae bacterium]